MVLHSPLLSPLDEFALHFTPDQLCFLQYTSGSTSSPKGVMIPWSALTHNMKTIVSSLEADDSTVVVSWLPQYHDMGLIGSLLSMLFISFHSVSFSFTPLRWLWRLLLASPLHPKPSPLAHTRLQIPRHSFARSQFRICPHSAPSALVQEHISTRPPFHSPYLQRG